MTNHTCLLFVNRWWSYTGTASKMRCPAAVHVHATPILNTVDRRTGNSDEFDICWRIGASRSGASGWLCLWSSALRLRFGHSAAVLGGAVGRSNASIVSRAIHTLGA